MSDELGGLAVEFGADISGLQAGIEEIKSKLASLTPAADETSGGFTGAIGKMTGGLLNFAGNVVTNIGNLQSLYGWVTNVGGSFLQAAAHEEQVETAFSTLLGSTKAAKDELEQLNFFAAKTPFQTDDIDQAAEKMFAFHFASKDVIPDLTAIGDTMSGLGKASGADLGSIVDIFGKIQAEGKLSGGVMMELSRWGIPAWQMLSKEMGKSVPELQSMVSHGLIPAKEALPLLTKGMEDTFGGGMAKQSETFNGLMSTLQSNIKLVWIEMSGPLFDAAKQGLTDLGNIVSSPAFAQFAKTLGQDVAGGLQVAGKYIGEFVGDVQGALKPGGDLQGIFQDIRDILPDVADFVKRVGDDLATNLLPPMKSLGEQVGTAVKNFAEWLDKSGTAKEAIGLLGDAIDTASGFLGGFVNYLSDLVKWANEGGPDVDALKIAILGVGGAITAIKLGAFVTNEVKGFIDGAKNAIDAVDKWSGKMKDLGSSILDVAGKIKDGLVGAFNWAKDKIKGDTDEMGKGLDDVKQKEEDVGTTAKDKMATDVETGATESENSLKGIETTAGEVETAEEGIGTTMKETVAPDVAAGSAEAEASIEGIATTADETAATVEADAATMEGSLSGVLSSISAVGMAMAGINFGEGSANQSGNNTLNNSTLQQEGRDEWKKVFGNLPMPNPSQMSASQLAQLYAAWQHDYPNQPFPFMQFGGGLASGGKNVPGGLYEIGERGSEYMYVPGGSSVFPHGSTPVSGGGSRQPVHIHVEVGGREYASYMIDDIMNMASQRMRLMHPGGRI